jgi:MGT family glycosyltransferase
LTKPLWKILVDQRREWKLPPHKKRDDAYSQLAQICQLPAIFDFPRDNVPKQLHYTGPLQNPDRVEPVSFNNLNFPFERLKNKPLIYASLGTLQNRNWTIFQTIAEACVDLDVQLVISLGNPNQDVSQINLAGSPITVAYAPHQQIIDRSTLVITHAGMNTTINTLSSGIPLVAIPITNEQPGIASRLARTGAGKVVPVAKLTVPKLKAAIVEVLNNPSYRQNAEKVQTAIQESRGVYTAADIIEKTISDIL